MLLLILFAFLGGVVTILSPCILPLLPIILSGSVVEGSQRPFGIVLGFIASFSFFTLFLSAIIKATGIPADILRNTAVVALFVFGLFLLVPQLQAILEKLLAGLSKLLPQSSNNGFWGGVILGLSLGLVWSPCVGPILASVITLAATSSVSLAAFFITIAYAVGTAIPMLIILFTGRTLLKKSPWLLSKGTSIQKVFAVMMMLMAVALFFNFDRSFQTWVVKTFPSYGVGLTQFEEIAPVQEQLQKLNPRAGTLNRNKESNTLLSKPGQKAPDFAGGNNWLNSEELSLERELQGKVVLVDFWTYSCINCIRTLPYVTEWYEKYKGQGFVVVGVHAPEFEFEKVTKNVEKAISDFNITYPVVQDNDFTIWKAYQNQYWPTHYLIDTNGDIRYIHFGEGNYTETENAIRSLLDEPLLAQKEESFLPSLNRRITRETYLGWSRAESYSRSNTIAIDQLGSYSLPSVILQGEVGLGGEWVVQKEQIVSRSENAQLSTAVTARDVFLVLAPTEGTSAGTVTVLIDGKPITAEQLTSDMNENGQITVTEPRKYDIAHFGTTPQEHTITLIFSNGVEAFAFTFG